MLRLSAFLLGKKNEKDVLPVDAELTAILQNLGFETVLANGEEDPLADLNSGLFRRQRHWLKVSPRLGTAKILALPGDDAVNGDRERPERSAPLLARCQFDARGNKLSLRSLPRNVAVSYPIAPFTKLFQLFLPPRVMPIVFFDRFPELKAEPRKIGAKVSWGRVAFIEQAILGQQPLQYSC